MRRASKSHALKRASTAAFRVASSGGGPASLASLTAVGGSAARRVQRTTVVMLSADSSISPKITSRSVLVRADEVSVNHLSHSCTRPRPHGRVSTRVGGRRTEIGLSMAGGSDLLRHETIVIDVHVLQSVKDLRLVRPHLHDRPGEGGKLELASAVDVPCAKDRFHAVHRAFVHRHHDVGLGCRLAVLYRTFFCLLVSSCTRHVIFLGTRATHGRSLAALSGLKAAAVPAHGQGPVREGPPGSGSVQSAAFSARGVHRLAARAGKGSRLGILKITPRPQRDHRTHTLPERRCKQAMLARGQWQATLTRDTTVLLPRSCTGFFLGKRRCPRKPSPILLARSPWGAA